MKCAASFVVCLICGSSLFGQSRPPAEQRQETPSGTPGFERPSGPFIRICTPKNPPPCATPPRAVLSPTPEYSKEARDAHYEGTCVLWLWVGTDGNPHSVRVARGLGHGLDEKAVDAVKKWKFEPAMMNGEPVDVQINVEVSFRLSAVSSAPAVPDSTKIELVKGEKAIYPLAAEEKKLQGQVWVRLHISETGDVEGVDVVSGDPILAEAAVKAVKKWKFKPYIKNGHPVKVLYKMPMDFAFRENVTPVPVENKASVDRNPSGAQDSVKPPVIPQSGRIQNIVPEEMWKRLTQCVFPIFPQLVESAHITGTVDIGLGISPAGDVGTYRVLRSDHPLLIQPALDAIRQWKFHPNVVQDEVTWSRIRALVRFNADGMTAVDLEHAILADNFGDPGTPASAGAGSAASTSVAVPRPKNAPACTVNASVDINPAVAPSRPADNPQNGNNVGGTKQVRISQQVSQGLLLHKVQPIYPDDARRNHIQGTVVLHALIDKNGRISNLSAISGPKELTAAAIGAVEQWRYRPYLLQDEPVEVQTEITVNFELR